jgi:hypothetical protein
VALSGQVFAANLTCQQPSVDLAAGVALQSAMLVPLPVMATVTAVAVANYVARGSANTLR